jgi:tetratricopeptide (TPR) repeat protein
MSTNLTEEIAPATQRQDDPFSAGDWLYWKCEFEKAREHFQAVLKQPSISASDLARCYKSMGAVEVELKNYDEALNIYNKQLDILLTTLDSPSRKEDIMSCYVSIGKVYWLKHDYDQAIAYHRQALEFALSFMASPSRISAVYKNLANIYTNAKKFDLALEHFQRALEIDHRHDPANHLQFGRTYANMGAMYQSKQNYNEALVYFEKARETWLKTLPPTHLSIEKIEKTIRKVKSKLGKPQNCPEDNFLVIDNAARNNSHIEPSLDIQVNITSNSLRLTSMSDIEVDWNLLNTA